MIIFVNIKVKTKGKLMSQCPMIRNSYRNRGHGFSRRVSFWGLFQNTKQFPVHSIPKSNPSLAKKKKTQPTQPSSAMAAILARKSLQALRARQLQLVSSSLPVSHSLRQSWTFTLTQFLGSSISRNWFLFVAYIVSSYFMLMGLMNFWSSRVGYREWKYLGVSFVNDDLWIKHVMH